MTMDELKRHGKHFVVTFLNWSPPSKQELIDGRNFFLAFYYQARVVDIRTVDGKENIIYEQSPDYHEAHAWFEAVMRLARGTLGNSFESQAFTVGCALSKRPATATVPLETAGQTSIG